MKFAAELDRLSQLYGAGTAGSEAKKKSCLATRSFTVKTADPQLQRVSPVNTTSHFTCSVAVLFFYATGVDLFFGGHLHYCKRRPPACQPLAHLPPFKSASSLMHEPTLSRQYMCNSLPICRRPILPELRRVQSATATACPHGPRSVSHWAAPPLPPRCSQIPLLNILVSRQRSDMLHWYCGRLGGADRLRRGRIGRGAYAGHIPS